MPRRRMAEAGLTVLGIVMLLASAVSRARAQSWQGVIVKQGSISYYIEDGKKRSILNSATATCLGGTAVQVDGRFLDSIPTGLPKTDCQQAPHPVSLFTYSFAMPDHPESQRIQAVIRMDSTGQVGGWLVYENTSVSSSTASKVWTRAKATRSVPAPRKSHSITECGLISFRALGYWTRAASRR